MNLFIQLQSYTVLEKGHRQFICTMCILELCVFVWGFTSRLTIFQPFWDSFLGLSSTKQWGWSVLLKDTTPHPGWGSNPRPCHQESDALPTELWVLPHSWATKRQQLLLNKLKVKNDLWNVFMSKFPERICQTLWLISQTCVKWSYKTRHILTFQKGGCLLLHEIALKASAIAAWK